MDKPLAKVAVLYIATGKYQVFWPEFLASCEANLLPGCTVHYFVFTDAPALAGQDGRCPALSPKALAALGGAAPAGPPAQDPATLAERVHRVPTQPLAWPYVTLKRFALFVPLLPRLEAEGFTHAYFLNGNYLCARPILPRELLPQGDQGLVLCRHPGYWQTKPIFFPYDRNPKSLAYIPYNRGSVYVCGGTNGGALAAYGALIRELDRRVEADLAHDVIARWHDESQLNRYALEHEGEYRLLSPEFCRPEGYDLPFAPAFLVLEKSNWLDVAAVKAGAAPRPTTRFEDSVLPRLYWLRDTLLQKQ